MAAIVMKGEKAVPNHIVVIGDRYMLLTMEIIKKTSLPAESLKTKMHIRLNEDGEIFDCYRHTLCIQTKYYSQRVDIVTFDNCEQFWAWRRVTGNFPHCIIFYVDPHDVLGISDAKNEVEDIASTLEFAFCNKILTLKPKLLGKNPIRSAFQKLANLNFMEFVPLEPNERDENIADYCVELVSYDRVYEVVTLTEWSAYNPCKLVETRKAEADVAEGEIEIAVKRPRLEATRPSDSAQQPSTSADPQPSTSAIKPPVVGTSTMSENGHPSGTELDRRLNNVFEIINVFGPSVPLNLQNIQMDEEFDSEMQGCAQQQLGKIWKECYDRKSRHIVQQRLLSEKIKSLERERAAEFCRQFRPEIEDTALKMTDMMKNPELYLGDVPKGDVPDIPNFKLIPKEEFYNYKKPAPKGPQVSCLCRCNSDGGDAAGKKAHSKKTEQNRKKKEKKRAKKMRNREDQGRNSQNLDEDHQLDDSEEEGSSPDQPVTQDESGKVGQIFDNINKADPKKLEGKDMIECLEKWKKVDSLSMDEKVVVAANLANNYIKNNSDEVVIQIEDPVQSPELTPEETKKNN